MKLKNTSRRPINTGNYYFNPGEEFELSVKEVKSDARARRVFELASVVDNRSEKAKNVDSGKTARKVLERTPENVEKWQKDPNKYDLKEVDD